MAKPGKARMPTTLRLLTGDRNHDRYNDHEPVPPTGDMVPPDDLSPEVLAVWRARLADLEAMALAFPSDIDLWRCYCEAVVVHEKASAVLAVSPVLVKGLHGGLVRNPAIQVQRDAALTVLRFGTVFGLSPSARSSVEAKKAASEDVNPFAGAV